MNRRRFLQSAAAAAFQKDRPNIVLIIADQHRGDCVGAAGNAQIHTPNLDRLARGGVIFRNAFSSTPTCTPARAALLTGMSPWNHGMLGYGVVAEHYPVELPRLLHDAGYYTTGIGKMHWHPQRALHGFDQTILDESGRVESVDFRSDYRSWLWSESPETDPDATGIGWNSYEARPFSLPERLHPTTWVGETALRFVQNYTKTQPFFLKISFERPHSPYDPPQKWWDFYKSPLPAAHSGDWAAKYRPRNNNTPEIWHGDLGQAVVQNSRRGYYGSVSFVDEQVGRILETLERQKILDRTLILYMSDHGDMLGDQFLWRKSYAYQGSARIPMILHWPEGFSGGRSLANPVEIRDVLPTFLDAAGASVPRGVDGQSLLQLIKNASVPWRKWIDLEHDVCYAAENHWNALTDGRRKYIFHAINGEEQFFNLEDDPQELKNLHSDAALPLWRERMVAHLAPRGEMWVRNGRLQARPKSQLYSLNYPKTLL